MLVCVLKFSQFMNLGVIGTRTSKIYLWLWIKGLMISSINMEAKM